MVRKERAAVRQPTSVPIIYRVSRCSLEAPKGLLRSRKREKKEEREPIVVLNLVLNCLHLINRGGGQRWDLVQRRLS